MRSTYKLLGVMINSSLKWDDHIDIMTKAAKRLWFLKKLKRAGVSVDDLLYYYQSVVRPVLEYACPVWHSSLSKQQIKSLENVQRRAVQIIAGNTSYFIPLLRWVFSRWLTDVLNCVEHSSHRL